MTQAEFAPVQAQASAGLNQLNIADYQRIQALNAAYKETFYFPFVVAVTELGVENIIAAIESTLGSGRGEEIVRSLSEIYIIAYFRQADLVDENTHF